MAAKKTIQKTIPVTKPQTKKFDKTFWIMAAIVFALSFIFYAKSLSNRNILGQKLSLQRLFQQKKILAMPSVVEHRNKSKEWGKIIVQNVFSKIFSKVLGFSGTFSKP